MSRISRPAFGTDGVRGTFGENLTAEFVYNLGRAITRVLGNDIPFLVGRDTRMSGPVLTNALTAGIESEKGTTRDAGILSTPGIATIARRDSLRACAITASHNPAPDNGVKVFDVAGIKIDSRREQEIEAELEKLLEHNDPYEPQENQLETFSDVTKDYVGYLYDALQGTYLDGLSIALDCSNGAAYGVAPAVFLLANARITAINTESDGVHINDECGATHLGSLVQCVREKRADIGFAFDGDADRVIVVDNSGNIRDGDTILGLFATEMKRHGDLTNNTVVATSMSNGGLKSYLHEHDIEFVETSVGDKYVLEEMLKNSYALGGEQSGHIIRTDYATWGDGILNALLIAKIFAEKRLTNAALTSAEMLDLFTPMIQLHDKVHVHNKERSHNNAEIESAIAQERALLGEDSRVIIRPSGTEEVVRITVEGLIAQSVQDSLARLAHVVQEVCK